jgi:hypothetical protein
MIMKDGVDKPVNVDTIPHVTILQGIRIAGLSSQCKSIFLKESHKKLLLDKGCNSRWHLHDNESHIDDGQGRRELTSMQVQVFLKTSQQCATVDDMRYHINVYEDV